MLIIMGFYCVMLWSVFLNIELAQNDNMGLQPIFSVYLDVVPLGKYV
jgi:hypothetical protein